MPPLFVLNHVGFDRTYARYFFVFTGDLMADGWCIDTNRPVHRVLMGIRIKCCFAHRHAFPFAINVPLRLISPMRPTGVVAYTAGDSATRPPEDATNRVREKTNNSNDVIYLNRVTYRPSMSKTARRWRRCSPSASRAAAAHT